jgi:hypothetical protein
MEQDHKLDQRALDDFVTFMKYSHRQFWDVVEKFWNPKIFLNVDGVWQLREPVYSDLKKV